MQHTADAGTIGNSSINWDISANAPFDASEVASFEVIFAELDGSGQPVNALVAETTGSTLSLTLSDMLNGTGGATNISAGAQDENGNSIPAITDLSTIVDTKHYIWFVEAFKANGDFLGDSDEFDFWNSTAAGGAQ